MRRAALNTLAPGLAARDFPRVLALSEDYPIGVERDNFVQGIAQTWAREGGDPHGAARWALGIGDEALRNQVLTGVAIEFAQAAPAEAAALVMSNFTPGVARDSAVATVTMRWATTDPAAAAAWAVEQTGENGRDALVRATLTHWVESDPAAAWQWVATIPAGPVQETAIGHYVTAWADHDPAAALNWAVGNGRDAALAPVVQRWLSAQPQQARAWVAAAPIADETKYRLLNDDPSQPRYDPR